MASKDELSLRKEFQRVFRRIFKRSNMLLGLCNLCWAACIMLFLHQTVFNLEGCTRSTTYGSLLHQAIFATLCHIGLSDLQEDSAEPSSSGEFHALPGVVNVAIFLLLLVPFFFVNQLATGGGLVYCSRHSDIGYVIRIFIFFVYLLIALQRFWKACYNVLLCLLVAVVSTAFNVKPDGHPDNKFAILGLSVLLLALSHHYFWVRGVEVAQARQQEALSSNNNFQAHCSEEV